MKHISTIISVIALVLAGFLFYTQSRQKEELKRLSEDSKKPTPNGFKIAYFDMDTLQAHYESFKEAQSQVKEQENAMNMELSSLDRSNQKKVEAWRAKGNTMTQAEGEQAQQEYAGMQQNFQNRKAALEQELYKKTEDLKTRIRKEIEDYLKDYNKQKSYSYIFEYDPSSFVYYKDTIYNITNELLDGLNSGYKKPH